MSLPSLSFLNLDGCPTKSMASQQGVCRGAARVVPSFTTHLRTNGPKLQSFSTSGRPLEIERQLRGQEVTLDCGGRLLVQQYPSKSNAKSQLEHASFSDTLIHNRATSSAPSPLGFQSPKGLVASRGHLVQVHLRVVPWQKPARGG